MSMVANFAAGAAAGAGCCAGAVCAADGVAANGPVTRIAGIETLMRSCPFALSVSRDDRTGLLPRGRADRPVYAERVSPPKRRNNPRCNAAPPRLHRVEGGVGRRWLDGCSQNVVPTANLNTNGLVGRPLLSITPSRCGFHALISRNGTL